MKKVIIIGAGIGGLTAGNLLTKKGHQITIFESHKMPGGYTAGFWRKGFYFESGTLSFEASAQVFKTMKEIGVFDKINFFKHEPFRFVSSGFDGIPATYQDYKQMIYTAYPSEKDRLDRYFAEVDRMYQAIQSLASEGFKLSKIVGGINMLRFYLMYKNVTISQFAERYFEKDSTLYRMFKAIGYPDMSAFILGGAMWSIFEDYWTVRDGMQSWADVLADNFKTLGGELQLNAYVDKILTSNGTAVGVRCNDTEYEADYVISASDYKQTFLKLLDKSDVPEDLYQKITRTSVSEGMFVVYLGLNISNEELKQLMKSDYVMYLDKSADVDIHNSQDKRYFEKADFSLYSLSLKNPQLAPEGKSSLMITTTTPYRWLNNWGDGDRQTYRKLKEQVKNTLIERASLIIPNLKELIEYQDAATPLTFERFTHNTDGATSAWSWNPHKKFYKQFWGVNIKTPVKNLLIGSCWATQIGGIPGALNAAYKCVRLIK
jgi:phytoene dehydrogenase-like protein